MRPIKSLLRFLIDYGSWVLLTLMLSATAAFAWPVLGLFCTLTRMI